MPPRSVAWYRYGGERVGGRGAAGGCQGDGDEAARMCGIAIRHFEEGRTTSSVPGSRGCGLAWSTFGRERHGGSTGAGTLQVTSGNDGAYHASPARSRTTAGVRKEWGARKAPACARARAPARQHPSDSTQALAIDDVLRRDRPRRTEQAAYNRAEERRLCSHGQRAALPKNGLHGIRIVHTHGQYR